MLNIHDAQFYKIQLKWAADNFDAEHRMRMTAELDDVRKQEDVALRSDAQLVLWMKDHLTLTGAGAGPVLRRRAGQTTAARADHRDLAVDHGNGYEARSFIRLPIHPSATP